MLNATSSIIIASTLVLLTGCTNNDKLTETTNQLNKAQQKILLLQNENKTLKHDLDTVKASLVQKEQMSQSVMAAKLDQPVQSATTAQRFNDIADVSTKMFIEDLSRLRVFDGLSNQFKPNQAMTRAEFITWVYNIHNALQQNATSQLRFADSLPQQFSDLPPTHPSYKYVQALANAGYSVGYEDGTFRPDALITREEMIGIKVGIDIGKNIQPSRNLMDLTWKFSDGRAIADKFTGYIYQDSLTGAPPYGNNIIRAFGKIGTFRPKQPVTRAEAAGALWAFGQYANIQKTTAGQALERQASAF